MCTRVFNNDQDSVFTTGRNMDWATALPTNIYIMPSGGWRTGLPANANMGCEPLKWPVAFNSVVAMVEDEAASDGMNSAGLVANVLYQCDCEYASKADRAGKKGLSVLRWVQYVLDCFDSVEAAVAAFHKGDIVICPADIPGEDTPASLHLSVSDRFGNSAIIEVNDGQYSIHEGPEYRVMTNDPRYSKQLILNNFWQYQWSEDNKFASNTLPGTPYSPDRFARASYYAWHVQSQTSEPAAVAQSLSVMRTVSVPVGYEVPGSPNLSTTLWSTVSVHAKGRYYFSDVSTPNIFWVDLTKPELVPGNNDIDPKTQSFVLPWNTDGDQMYYAGCANGSFEITSDPFATSRPQ